MMRPAGDEYYRYQQQPQQYHHHHQQQQQQQQGPVPGFGGGGFEGFGFNIGGTPHGAIMAVVLGLVVAGPLFLGEGGEAITGAIADALGPTGMLLLPVALVLVIRVLSSYSDHRGGPGAAIADALFRGGGGGGSPADRFAGGGSPVGVALALVLIGVLLYYRSVLLGGGDGGDDE